MEKKEGEKKGMPCDEILEKHMQTTEDRLNDHAGRIRDLEKSTAVTDERVDNLCDTMGKLTKAIYSLVASILATLVGFFVYAIQTGIFK